MINLTDIPKSELEFSGNLSVFNYEVGVDTFLNREQIWQRFIDSDYDEAFQLLDNGILIITQNLFGGKSIVSKFTCGLYFCYCVSKYLNGIENIEQEIRATIGADDCYSGWDYDFNLKIISEERNILKLIKDYDFKTEVEFDRVSFLKNYQIFANKTIRLFKSLYPEITKHPKFKQLEEFNLKSKF